MVSGRHIVLLVDSWIEYIGQSGAQSQRRCGRGEPRSRCRCGRVEPQIAEALYIRRVRAPACVRAGVCARLCMWVWVRVCVCVWVGGCLCVWVRGYVCLSVCLPICASPAMGRAASRGSRAVPRVRGTSTFVEYLEYLESTPRLSASSIPFQFRLRALTRAAAPSVLHPIVYLVATQRSRLHAIVARRNQQRARGSACCCKPRRAAPPPVLHPIVPCCNSLLQRVVPCCNQASLCGSSCCRARCCTPRRAAATTSRSRGG